MHSSFVQPQSSTRQQLLNPRSGFARTTQQQQQQQQQRDFDQQREQQQPGQQQQHKMQYPAASSLHADESFSPACSAQDDHHQKQTGARQLAISSSPFSACRQPAVHQQQHLELADLGSATAAPHAPPAYDTQGAAAACSAQTSASASPGDSRGTSRQSSLKALLPARMLRSASSQQHHKSSGPSSSTLQEPLCQLEEVREAEGVRNAASRQRKNKAKKQHWNIFGGSSNTIGKASGTLDDSSAVAVVKDVETGAQPKQLSAACGKTGSRRPGSSSSMGCGTSDNTRRGVSWNSHGDESDGDSDSIMEKHRRLQQQHKQQQAAAAAAKAAAEKLGADVEWYRFKTGDPLLDRHIVVVDPAADLAWAGQTAGAVLLVAI
jgi:hypothetical protein